MDIELLTSKKKLNKSSNTLPKKKLFTSFDEDDSGDASLEVEFLGGTKNNNNYSQKIVDAPINDEGEVIVGEDLFMEMCDAWLETHGAKVLETVLKKHKNLIQEAVVMTNIIKDVKK